jgi:hypothetical protein
MQYRRQLPPWREVSLGGLPDFAPAFLQANKRSQRRGYGQGQNWTPIGGQYWAPIDRQFTVDILTGELACATPLHFVPFAEEVSRTVVDMLIDGFIRPGKGTIGEVRGPTTEKAVRSMHVQRAVAPWWLMHQPLSDLNPLHCVYSNMIPNKGITHELLSLPSMSCTKPFITTPLSLAIPCGGVRCHSANTICRPAPDRRVHASLFARLVVLEESEKNDDRNRHA